MFSGRKLVMTILLGILIAMAISFAYMATDYQARMAKHSNDTYSESKIGTVEDSGWTVDDA